VAVRRPHAFACHPLLGASAAQAPAPDPAPRPFCRFVEDGAGGHLDVMVARYRRGDATVALHASVHVADPGHYRALQLRFRSFDVLLYELVAERDLRPGPDLELDDGDPLSVLMNAFGNGLGLSDQLAVLDYRQPNFVHADMTPAELDAAMAAAGRSTFGELLAGQPEIDREAEAQRRKVDMVAAFRGGRGRHELRVMMARLMAEEERRRKSTVLIEGRNERCLDVLRRELAAGRARIGIYYGAAHMAHLERRLVEDLGFANTGEEWLVAWDCSPERDPVQEKGLQQKRYRARRDLESLHAAVPEWRRTHGRRRVPTWPELRQALPGGRLPGYADGLDPWGREYVLRPLDGGRSFEVRCCGSDGVIDTGDDVAWTPP
jgi:hypothetical protein